LREWESAATWHVRIVRRTTAAITSTTGSRAATWPDTEASRTWLIRAAALPGLIRTAALSRRAAHTRRLLPRDVLEDPLVVVVAAVVETNRGFLALADDANNAGLETDGAASRCTETAGLCASCSSPSLARWRRRRSATRACAAGCLWRLLRDGRVRREEIEILAGDRVLVFLAEEFLIDQDVDICRQRAWQFTAVQLDGASVLLAAEDQLLFLLPLGRLLPDRHGDRHHDGHHADADEQHGHGVAALADAALRISAQTSLTIVTILTG